MGLSPMRLLPPNSHLLSRLEPSLSPSRIALFQTVVQSARDFEAPLFLVGGSVRDLLLEAPLTDLDMTVEGDAVGLASEAAARTGARLKTHRRFGVATLALGGNRIDVATTRTEVYSRPGALPKVAPGNILSDLKRRDFTINSMALALTGENAGTLLDPLHGRKDLEEGLVRTLHPNSFIDDATRLLRAARYETRLGLSLDKETESLLGEAVQGRLLDTVSGDRVRKEIELTFHEPDPLKTLNRFRELGILAAIHPSLGKCLPSRGVENGSPLLWLALTAYGVSYNDGTAIIQRLRMPSRWAKVVMDTVEVAARPEQDLLGLPPQKLAEWLDSRSPYSVEAAAMLTSNPDVAETLRRYLKSWRNVKPLLTGRDLASLGAEEGPMVGDLIRKLKEARITGMVCSREEETELAKKFIRTKGG